MLEVRSPYDSKVVREIQEQDKQAAEAALSKAYALFQDQKNWLKPHQRISIVKAAAEIMQSRFEDLARIATLEGGKPIQDSEAEVKRAINTVQIAAEEIGNLHGEEIPMGLTQASEQRLAFSMREPIGVVLSISAFNHPLNLVAHQVITAVAAGCPVIVKPAQITPLSCIAFTDILLEAGLPEGWCQTVVCSDEVSEFMVTDKRTAFLSFIGSAKVGWYLRSKLAPGTRCVLEHGGAAPVIVAQDADIEKMIPALTKGGFYHAGQVCVSVQRVFIDENIIDDVVDQLARQAENLVLGDPLDPNTQVGPLISPDEVDRIAEWINEAVESGAELVCGGKKTSDNFYSPTILLNPPLDAKVSTQEIFGPVICAYSYSDQDKAIVIANQLQMHFQAAVFTQNIDNALYCIKRLNATAVMVNDHTAFRVDWMPFGGRDASGLGMGGIKYTMKDMTRLKLAVFKSNVV